MKDIFNYSIIRKRYRQLFVEILTIALCSCSSIEPKLHSDGCYRDETGLSHIYLQDIADGAIFFKGCYEKYNACAKNQTMPIRAFKYLYAPIITSEEDAPVCEKMSKNQLPINAEKVVASKESFDKVSIYN